MYRRGYGFVRIALFLTQRRVPVLKSTWVHVMMSLPWRGSLKCVGLLALCRISATKNNKWLYSYFEYTRTETNNITYLNDLSKFWDCCWRVSRPSIAGYTARQYRRVLQQIGAIVLNYCCYNTAVCTLLRSQDARPRHSNRV